MTKNRDAHVQVNGVRIGKLAEDEHASDAKASVHCLRNQALG